MKHKYFGGKDKVLFFVLINKTKELYFEGF
ncbi:hypothetical protein SHD_0056 [Shewanella decolorationis S12]|uniref:Uncharacterized protein n=1 Tax=Shewanella decolorationis S12 TaxID=1353536 RepID=A0ABN0PSY2_9GAMM|nr:hypothetical protein SHD_0056 [Shewanella decolorationis S12]